MFVINNGSVYQITRESAMYALRDVIKKELESHYNAEFLEEVVEEIMLYVSFPNVMDSNDVYIFQDDMFHKYILKTEIVSTGEQYKISQFRPNYTGPEVKEIANIFKYSFEQLIYGQMERRKAMIFQMDNENYGVKSMAEDMKPIVKVALLEVLSESDIKLAYDTIIQQTHSTNSVLVMLRQKNDIAYYSLMADGTCKKLDIFSTTELKKVIMRNLPNLKSIAKKIETIAIYLHNKILYGSEIRDYELTSPIGFKGEKPIFKREVEKMEFFLDIKTGEWISDYIKINCQDIIFNGPCSLEKYPTRVGTYKGYQIFEKGDDDMPEDEKYLIVKAYESLKEDRRHDYYTFVSYPYRDYFHNPDFTAYIRVKLDLNNIQN